MNILALPGLLLLLVASANTIDISSNLLGDVKIFEQMTIGEIIDFMLEAAKDAISNYDEVRDRFDETYDEYGGIDLSSFLSALAGGAVTNETCILCKNALGLVQLFKDSDSLTGLLKPVCDNSATIDHEECNGLLNRLGPQLFYIIKNTVLSLEEVCSVSFSEVCLKYLKFTPSKKVSPAVVVDCGPNLILLFLSSLGSFSGRCQFQTRKLSIHDLLVRRGSCECCI